MYFLSTEQAHWLYLPLLASDTSVECSVTRVIVFPQQGIKYQWKNLCFTQSLADTQSKILTYCTTFLMHSFSSQCLWKGITFGDLTCLSWWPDRYFVFFRKLQTGRRTTLSHTVDLYTQQKILVGQMSEELCYWLDSCHGNQGAWHLIFPQLNYDMLLIEENTFFPPCELDSGAFTSLVIPFFPVLWCDTHT